MIMLNVIMLSVVAPTMAIHLDLFQSSMVEQILVSRIGGKMIIECGKECLLKWKDQYS